MPSAVVGRLAPSPTGHLHLGNAWSFLWAWAACRQAGGRLLLRLEDIDPDRSTPAFAADLMDDLRWLGLDWDGEPRVQSQRHAAYDAALTRLVDAGCLYPCYCTRKELRAQLNELTALAGAPHVDDRGAPYPGTCRDLTLEQRHARKATGRPPCLRLNTTNLPPVDFVDAVCGPQHHTLEACGGDFALRRSDGVYAYQLAVVVDDAQSGVTQVVRGNDILLSTPRQIALLRLLGHTPPRYAHVPLLCDEHGERLAKRHASLSLQALRATGTPPERVLGLLASKAGIFTSPQPCGLDHILAGFVLERFQNDALKQGVFQKQNSLEQFKTAPVILSPADLAFLRSNV